MLFFRVEEPSTHHGPYVATKAPSLNRFMEETLHIDCYSYDHNRQPAPYEDDGNMRNWNRGPYKGNTLFGFLSLDQLFSWFYREEELAFLKSGYYVCAIYEAEHIPFSSSHQAVAYADSLTFIEAMPF